MDKELDVVIIGGGIVGTAIARELSRYQLRVALVEKEADVGWGTTKANSAVVHTGYDPKPGTLMAKLNVQGARLFPSICEELDVPYKKLGSLVLTPNEEGFRELEELKERGKINGVTNLEIITQEKLFELEPNLSRDIKGALWIKDTAITSPVELTIALRENAERNGVRFILDTTVTGFELEDRKIKSIRTDKGFLKANWIINAAGVYSDDVARFAGDESFSITPVKGEYALFDKEIGNLVNHVIFPLPTETTKGILVLPTVDGNLLVGPNEHTTSKDDTNVTEEGLRGIISFAKGEVPNLPLSMLITVFAGLRAKELNRKDFVIEPSPVVENLINVGGIQSPGLSSAPAIALYVIEILKDKGVELVKKRDFIPERKAIPRFANLSWEERTRLIAQDSNYGEIICRCEHVTVGEIIEAVRRGANTLDGIKFRTRAGSGRCQGGFCGPRLIPLLSQLLEVPPEEITKKGKESRLVIGETKR
ncbi:MAG: NAD(P)/FAD-dependent oxidoreductase [bacterium]|nr:NAD(P)/FAD-dependent oxidoreductase [bacterium]